MLWTEDPLMWLPRRFNGVMYSVDLELYGHTASLGLVLVCTKAFMQAVFLEGRSKRTGEVCSFAEKSWKNLIGEIDEMGFFTRSSYSHPILDRAAETQSKEYSSSSNRIVHA